MLVCFGEAAVLGTGQEAAKSEAATAAPSAKTEAALKLPEHSEICSDEVELACGLAVFTVSLSTDIAIDFQSRFGHGNLYWIWKLREEIRWKKLEKQQHF